MRLVIDASIGGSWCLDDEQSELADSLLAMVEDSHFLVPSHWFLELANLLVVAERRSRIDPEGVRNATRLLRSLPISVDSVSSAQAFGPTIELARRHHLTSYDAAYLELAIREGAGLATLDQRLSRAALAEGVRLLPV